MSIRAWVIVCNLTLFWISGSMANNLSGQPGEQPSHPFLFINRGGIERVKKEIRETSWKLSSWQILKTQADLILDERTDIPARGGNWEQYYINPQTGATLVRGKQTGPGFQN